VGVVVAVEIDDDEEAKGEHTSGPDSIPEFRKIRFMELMLGILKNSFSIGINYKNVIHFISICFDVRYIYNLNVR
jgi:hypothetical protein